MKPGLDVIDIDINDNIEYHEPIYMVYLLPLLALMGNVILYVHLLSIIFMSPFQSIPKGVIIRFNYWFKHDVSCIVRADAWRGSQGSVSKQGT